MATTTGSSGIRSFFLHCLRRLAQETRGNLAILTAFLMVPLAAAGGVAIDYGRIAQTRTQVQAALDSATLASAAKNGGLDAGSAKKYFAANVDAGGVTITGPTFDKAADGTITGTVTANITGGVMGFLGYGSVAANLTSKAKGVFPTKVTSATYQILSAQGAYDKDMYIWTKDKDGNILAETLVLQYDYTYKNGVGTKVYTPAIGGTKAVTVGSYQTYGMKMVVYEDLSYTGKKVNPVSYYSDATNAANWTHTSGTCSSGQTQNWEDGGDSNYLDFVFKLTCATGSSGSPVIRLSK